MGAEHDHFIQQSSDLIHGVANVPKNRATHGPRKTSIITSASRRQHLEKWIEVIQLLQKIVGARRDQRINIGARLVERTSTLQGLNLTGQSDADLDSKQGLAGLLIGLGTSVGVVVNISSGSLLEREDIEKLGVLRISSKLSLPAMATSIMASCTFAPFSMRHRASPASPGLASRTLGKNSGCWFEYTRPTAPSASHRRPS